MKNPRFKPEIRKAEILGVALILAADCGYMHVTRDAIADAIGVSGPAVQYHFGTMAKLRRSLMRHAVEHRNPRVVAQGLAMNDEQAAKADEKLKELARKTMS